MEGKLPPVLGRDKSLTLGRLIKALKLPNPQ